MSSLAFLGLEDAAAKAELKATPARANALSAPGSADRDPEFAGYSSSDGYANRSGGGVVSTHIPIHLS